MLTIKRIGMDGRESVVQAVSVSMDHKTGQLIGHGPEDVRFSSGHIYVMNEQGQTVSVYNLDKKQ